MRLNKDFFQRDVLEVAPDLLGNVLVRKFEDEIEKRFVITEVEAYRGEEDLACHASKGRTKRTEVMYEEGGKIYVYLIYGMYWMLNLVTGEKENPQAVLVRGMYEITDGRWNRKEIVGSGKVGRVLQIDKSFYGEDLTSSNRIWVEDGGVRSFDSSCSLKMTIERLPRVGVEYAGKWAKKLWRFRSK